MIMFIGIVVAYILYIVDIYIFGMSKALTEILRKYPIEIIKCIYVSMTTANTKLYFQKKYAYCNIYRSLRKDL